MDAEPRVSGGGPATDASVLSARRGTPPVRGGGGRGLPREDHSWERLPAQKGGPLDPGRRAEAGGSDHLKEVTLRL